MLITLNINNNITINDSFPPFFYEIKKDIDNIHFSFGNKSSPSLEYLQTKLNPDFRIIKKQYKLFMGKFTHGIKIKSRLGTICCGKTSELYFVYNPVLDDFILKETIFDALKFSKIVDSQIEAFIKQNIKEIEQSRKEIDTRNKNSFERKFSETNEGKELQIMVEKVPDGTLLGIQEVVIQELVRRNSGEARTPSKNHQREKSKDDLYIK